MAVGSGRPWGRPHHPSALDAQVEGQGGEAPATAMLSDARPRRLAVHVKPL